jgi:hypothetical protein
VCFIDIATKKLCSCGKEQTSAVLATDIGKGGIKIIDPVGAELYRHRETERGERRGRRCEYGGRVYEK